MRSLGGEGEVVVGAVGRGGGGAWVLRTVEFWVFRVHTEMLDFPAV